jgi:hypothetical protein
VRKTDGELTSDESSKPEYSEYLNSPEWKQRRAECLRMSKYTCARCGLVKPASQLHVHHLTYERLGNELPADLQVVCLACHWDADKERKAAGPTARDEGYDHSKLRAGFNGWMINGLNEDWYNWDDFTVMRNAQRFLESIGLDPDNPALVEATCGVERMRRSRVQQLLDIASREFPRSIGKEDEPWYARVIGMREIADAWDKPMLDQELEGVVRTAQFYKVPYERYRMELNGPHEGEWRKIQQFDGTTLTQTTGDLQP